jgi:carboxyl-terminal processing protease
MKPLKLLILAASLATGLISAVAFYPAPDNPEKEKAIVSTAINALNGLHYEPVVLDDEFSQKVYRVYLDRIDGSRRFFTQEDLNIFAAHENEIDNQLDQADLTFFNVVEERFELALQRSQDIYRDVLKTPFNFDQVESVELDGEKKPYPTDAAQLRESWRKTLKWETMSRLNDKLEQQEALRNKTTEEEAEDEDAVENLYEKLGMEESPENTDVEDDKSDEELLNKSEAELEEDARASVLKSFDDWYERMRKLKRNDRLSDYLNAVTSVYDPHTGYFAPVDKENFDISMAGKLEGIGARLQTDGEYTKVTDVVAGGPAWKGKELAEKDVIMKVAQEGEEPVDIGGMNINEVVQLIRGKKGTKVTLTVKQVDGTIADIEIIRDVVILEEGFAKSVILDTEVGEKVGYIRLPRFYADFSDDKGRSSFRDIRTEVEKLKTESVGGIILDLRSNGGGSLRDVVDMTGLFIDEGPIVQVKSRGRNPEVLEDDDSKVQYDGPLVVMVNEFSASASEILAAALQDYGRAVIVGNKTFGKGTVQRFIDLDVAVRGANNVKPLGNLKVTTQKFYRVNGGSTQLEGVTPDIFLPDNFAYLETGERENDYPLQWDKIAPAAYNRVPAYVAPLPKIREKSMARTKSNEVFQAIDQYAKDLKADRDESIVSLNLKDYTADQTVRSAESKAYKELFKEIDAMQVDNLKLDKLQLENADEGKIDRNKDFKERLKKDIHLYETVLIMNDMIDEDVRVAERQ